MHEIAVKELLSNHIKHGEMHFTRRHASPSTMLIKCQ